MSRPHEDLDRQIVELKRRFDEAFSHPVLQHEPDWVDFLIVLVSEQLHAMPIATLAGLEGNQELVPLPAAAGGFVGLAAIHGEAVPVFDLAAVLGAHSSHVHGRWLALYRDTEPVALAFDGLRGLRRVACRDIIRASPDDGAPPARDAITVDGRVAHIIDVPSVVALIRKNAHRPLS